MKPRKPFASLFACLALSALLVAGSAFAAPDPSTSEESGKPEQVLDVSAPPKKYQKWAFFPIIASEAQTGLQLGALAIRFIQPENPADRTSTIDFIAFGTTKGQYFGEIRPDLYFSGGRYHLGTGVSGGFWPMNYYGIGDHTPEENEEEYDSTEFRFSFLLEQRLFQVFYAGVAGLYEYSDVEIENPRLLTSQQIAGTAGRTKSGLGLNLAYDSRDNVNDARSGSFIRLAPLFFEKGLGSDNKFQIYELDMNHYQGVAENTALALRGYLRVARGDIPFQDYSTPDGSRLLRGIEAGRYRDRDLIGFQSEFRYPIYRKWGGTVFAETAQVAHEFTDLDGSGWKYSIGAGVRYALNPAERFNIRLDVSWVDGGFGLVLNIREAI